MIQAINRPPNELPPRPPSERGGRRPEGRNIFSSLAINVNTLHFRWRASIEAVRVQQAFVCVCVSFLLMVRLLQHFLDELVDLLPAVSRLASLEVMQELGLLRESSEGGGELERP